MPTLIRFVIMIGGLIGLVYAGMYLLATGVKVQPREISQIVELPKANK